MVNKYLLNFSVSRSGGGYKRLFEYARAMNNRGGAHFIIHPDSRSLIDQFPNNKYYVVRQSKIKRVFNDFGYLNQIIDVCGYPDFYYSYGIPIISRIAKVNWFHLSNVLPLCPGGMPMALIDLLKMRLLGPKIKRGFKNADVISAESEYSLGLVDGRWKSKLFLSVNGSDDEIHFLNSLSPRIKKDIAVVMGTYRHKAIQDSYHIFKVLKKNRSVNLKLLLAGDSTRIPRAIKLDPDVIVLGYLERVELMSILNTAKFYISTTRIENSYNAASEGIFLAEESYISDIQPHLELLLGEVYGFSDMPGLSRRIAHVERRRLKGINLKKWDEVVDEMVQEFKRVLGAKVN